MNPLDKDRLIAIAKEGAESNFLKIDKDLPPIVLTLDSEGDVKISIIKAENEKELSDKLRDLLWDNKSIEYVFISNASATKFADKARELGNVFEMADEDRMDILFVVYIKNSSIVESHYAIVENRKDISEWEKKPIDVLGNALVKEW